MHFSVVALALAAALTGSPAQTSAKALPQAQTVEQYVRAYYADTPVLAEIASCESEFRQFDKDGKVLKNPGSSAVGIMQIMATIHSQTADTLGLDPYTMQGNLAYAKYLYSKEGTSPWNASKACWGKSKAATALAMK